MSLQSEARQKLNAIYESVTVLSNSPSIWLVNSYAANVRTASRKSGDKFWFDVTPEIYEKRQVEFFLYVCGAPEQIYVFPRLNFERLIKGASLGGQKQVPNFTIYLNTHEFEPAGHSKQRHEIRGFFNARHLIPPL